MKILETRPAKNPRAKDVEALEHVIGLVSIDPSFVSMFSSLARVKMIQELSMMARLIEHEGRNRRR